MAMIEKFLDYLRYERNCSVLTVSSYGADLRAFASYFKTLDAHLSWTTVDADVIRDWMESMIDRGNTASSVDRRLSAVRSLYRFALSRGLIDTDPAVGIVGPKREKLLPVFLNSAQMDTLLDYVMAETHCYQDVLARTIIMTFYETGIRLSELVGLDDTSVDVISKFLKVLGKGRKERIVPFGDELATALQTYKETRDETYPQRPDTAFFAGRKGERVKTSEVRRIVQRCLSAVSTQKKKSPHVLRHTFATAMLNNGAEIESVRRLLGHESLSTTEIYTHTTSEQLKRVYNEAHPRA